MADPRTVAAFSALAARASRDASFRALLLADPQAAARRAGVDIPAGANFVEKPFGADHLVVLSADGAPAAPRRD